MYSNIQIGQFITLKHNNLIIKWQMQYNWYIPPNLKKNGQIIIKLVIKIKTCLLSYLKMCNNG